MHKRRLGRTDMDLSVLSYGASSLGQEFRRIDLTEALTSVQMALELGINFIDTSPFYGRGLSEILLGRVLPEIPRESFYLGTKLGRYSYEHFDFSAKRVVESVEVSMRRMGVDYLDIVLCHDIEYADLNQIVEVTLPALREEVSKGNVRYVGISGYPMKVFDHIIQHAPIDVVLTYNHYTLQNDMALGLAERCAAAGVGIMNAAPFAARLLTNATLPDWHKATPEVRRLARKAADHCREREVDIAQLALQFAIASPAFATCITGSASPARVAEWVDWIERPLDEALLRETLAILRPVHNWFHMEGRPENNDALPVSTGVA
ncbi:MAG: aldo/keto reductase [Planctomycetota bacterium]